MKVTEAALGDVKATTRAIKREVAEAEKEVKKFAKQGKQVTAEAQKRLDDANRKLDAYEKRAKASANDKIIDGAIARAKENHSRNRAAARAEEFSRSRAEQLYRAGESRAERGRYWGQFANDPMHGALGELDAFTGGRTASRYRGFMDKVVGKDGRGNSIRRGQQIDGAMGKIRSGLGYAAAGAAIVAGISSFAAGGGDERRIEESDARIASHSQSATQRQLAARRLQASTPLRSIAAMDIRQGLGALGARLGLGSRKTERLATQADIEGSGLGGVKVGQLRSLANSRRLEASGLAGAAYDAVLKSNPITARLSEEADTAKAKAMLDRASGLRSQSMQDLDLGNFAAAEAALRESAIELGQQPKVWAIPELFKQQEASRAARGAWARNNMARAGPRTGD